LEALQSDVAMLTHQLSSTLLTADVKALSQFVLFRDKLLSTTLFSDSDEGLETLNVSCRQWC